MIGSLGFSSGYRPPWPRGVVVIAVAFAIDGAELRPPLQHDGRHL